MTTLSREDVDRVRERIARAHELAAIQFPVADHARFGAVFPQATQLLELREIGGQYEPGG